ncbi:unnamed protein product [Calypogeia fissa]
MGALRPKRSSPPSLSPWQQQQQQASFQSMAFAACKTVFLLAVSCVLGFCFLRVVARSPAVKGTEAINLLVDGVGHVINLEEGPHNEKVYLGAVIFNRVFPEDLFNITAYECKQWIEYMLFAGVQHIYWYDTAHSDGESQQAYLQEYVEKGLLTYHRFHHLYPGNLDSGYHFEQDHAYEHFLETYGFEVAWVVEMDVDEYPFMLSDLNKLFLRRYVEYQAKARPDVSQILMPCMIFGGNPKGDLENGWVIERYQRRKRVTEGVRAGFASRTKPIFQPKHAKGVGFLDPHQFPMASGDTLIADPEKLRMNHYWGPRLTDFGPDTSAVLSLLVPDDSAQPIATELKERTGLADKKACLQHRRPS